MSPKKVSLRFHRCIDKLTSYGNSVDEIELYFTTDFMIPLSVALGDGNCRGGSVAFDR